MKAIVTFVIALFFSTLQAQTNELNDVWQRQISNQKTGMYVLAGWSVANIAVGGLSIANAQGSTRYLHEMNIYWNVANLGIAGLGLLGIRKQQSKPATLANVIDYQHSIEKKLLFNSGLDLAYIASGAYLVERGKTQLTLTDQDRGKGYGQSVMIQGGFLLLFDVTNYLLHSSNNKKIQRTLEKVTLTSNGISIRI